MNHTALSPDADNFNGSNVEGTRSNCGIGLVPFCGRKVPIVRFLEPQGRRFSRLLWWHVPIELDEPKTRLSAQFTRKEIVHCEARIATAHGRTRSVMKLHWKSKGPKGIWRQTLRYNQEYALPIAIRSAGNQAIYLDALGKPMLTLGAGECFITEENFIHHNRKHEPARLIPGENYQIQIKLTTAKIPGWCSTAAYSLRVPLQDQSNSEFKLIRQESSGHAE